MNNQQKSLTRRVESLEAGIAQILALLQAGTKPAETKPAASKPATKPAAKLRVERPSQKVIYQSASAGTFCFVTDLVSGQPMPSLEEARQSFLSSCRQAGVFVTCKRKDMTGWTTEVV